jgi:hypothetical protein
LRTRILLEDIDETVRDIQLGGGPVRFGKRLTLGQVQGSPILLDGTRGESTMTPGIGQIRCAYSVMGFE